MNRILPLSLLALAAAACSAEPPAGPSEEARTRLSEMIGDRVPGPPQSCVQLRDLAGNESAGEGAIVFRTNSANLIYVNRPPAGCPEINSGRALKLRTPMTRACRGDIVEVFDTVSGTTYGGCGLGDFTPYRRPR